MKLYVIKNKEGKFFRSIGYGGNRTNWVEKIEDSKIYFKAGQAKGRVTYFYKRWPEFGCPDILEFEIDVKEAKVIDLKSETDKKIVNLEKKRLKREQKIKDFQIEFLRKEKEKINSKLKSILGDLN